MRLLNKKNLEKLKKKNKGNIRLFKGTEKLINDIEINNWTCKSELYESRNDADHVHSDGFFFFNINVHRVLILLEFDDREATIVWSGSHDEYVSIFRNNKSTIHKWLKKNDWI